RPGPAGGPPGPQRHRHRRRRAPRLPRGPGRAVGRGPPAARRRARRGHRRRATDDADQLARFASDVVPTLRAAVAAERERRRAPPAPRRVPTAHGTAAAGHRGFLEGPAGRWAEDLLPLVVEHGVGTVVWPPTTPTSSPASQATSFRRCARRSRRNGSAAAPRL